MRPKGFGIHPHIAEKRGSKVVYGTFGHTVCIIEYFDLSLTAALAQEPLRSLSLPLHRPSPLRGLLRGVVLFRAVQGGGLEHLPQIRVQNEALRDAALHGRRIHGHFHGNPHYNAETGELLSQEKGPNLGAARGRSSGGKR